jgi:HEAT repeat protein
MSLPKPDHPLALELRDPDYRRRVAALTRLGERPETPVDAEAMEALIENLAVDNKPIQRHAITVLAAIGGRDPAIVARLTELLQAPAAPARWAAAYTLGLIDGALDLRACGPLLEALASSDGDIRWAALDLLVRLGRRHPDAIRDRLLELHSRADANSRKMSLYALRELRLCDRGVLAAVNAASASPDSHVRLAALSFLRQAAGAAPAAVDIALHCLKSDPDQGVRRAAAGTLGYLKDRSARVLAALREAADTPHDASLRKAALQTLARLKEEP